MWRQSIKCELTGFLLFKISCLISKMTIDSMVDYKILDCDCSSEFWIIIHITIQIILQTSFLNCISLSTPNLPSSPPQYERMNAVYSASPDSCYVKPMRCKQLALCSMALSSLSGSPAGSRHTVCWELLRKRLAQCEQDHRH